MSVPNACPAPRQPRAPAVVLAWRRNSKHCWNAHCAPCVYAVTRVMGRFGQRTAWFANVRTEASAAWQLLCGPDTKAACQRSCRAHAKSCAPAHTQ